jgi:hypothetical protein
MPPKKSKQSTLRQTRLAGINSHGTFATPRSRLSASPAIAPAKQKSLTDCGFAKKSRDPPVADVEAADSSPPSTKRRKRYISFEVEETQLQKPAKPLKLLELPQQEFHGNEDEVIKEPEFTEEFAPHFSASSINYSDPSDSLLQSTSRSSLPYEIPSSQTPKKKRPQRPVDTGAMISHEAASFQRDHTKSVVKSSETVLRFSESQPQVVKQKKIPSSQDWENEDTQSKTLSTQASSQSDARIDENANQDETLLPATDSSISRCKDNNQSMPRSVCLDIRNVQSIETDSPLDETSETKITESENDKSLSHELKAIHVEPDQISNDGTYDSDEGVLDHKFEFKPVRTQQLPASLLFPQDLPGPSSEEILSGLPPQVSDNEPICDGEEDNDASNFSQLLPETLMESFPMPPPLSQPDSYSSGSDTE